MANEWIVYPCYTHVSFQMNAISLCVIILSSIKILATIPLFMLSLHNSFMLLCLAVLSCAVALAVAVYRLILSSVLASLLALYPTSPPGFTLLSPALRPRHSLLLTLNSLTIYFIRMYVCMCVCDAFYCWLIWWWWFVDSDIAWLRIQLVIDSLWGCQICWTYLLSNPFSFNHLSITMFSFAHALAFVHSFVVFVVVLIWERQKERMVRMEQSFILLIY